MGKFASEDADPGIPGGAAYNDEAAGIPGGPTCKDEEEGGEFLYFGFGSNLCAERLRIQNPVHPDHTTL